MKTMVRVLIGLGLFGLMSVAVQAHDVTYDFDRTQDFSRLKTYALTVPASDNPLVDERLAAAVAAQLAARGLRRDDVHPDVFVTVRQTFDTHKEYTAYNTGYGPYGWGGWGWGYYGASWGLGGYGYTNIDVENVTVRTLTIELNAAATEKLVWRGVSKRTVHPMSKPERVSKRTNHEVDDIFENYPHGDR